MAQGFWYSGVIGLDEILMGGHLKRERQIHVGCEKFATFEK